MRSYFLTTHLPWTLRNAFVFAITVGSATPTCLAAFFGLTLSRRTSEITSSDFLRRRRCSGVNCRSGSSQIGIICPATVRLRLFDALRRFPFLGKHWSFICLGQLESMIRNVSCSLHCGNYYTEGI